MSPHESLRLDIESCELHHAAYMVHYEYLRQCIDDAIHGYAPTLSWVIGPSRVGKSMLMKSLARKYPETVVDGQRCIPVLVVELPPGVSPLKLPIAVLEALGILSPPREEDRLRKLMKDQLKLAQVKFTFFDETSHIVEVGSKMPPRAAGDWFKSRSDIDLISMAFLGVPRLEKLLLSNEQLRLRSESRREFRPYNFTIREDQAAFTSCVKTYCTIFLRHGWEIVVPVAVLVRNCYLLGGGLIGLVSHFFLALVKEIRHAPPRPISFEDCAAAAKAIEQAGHPLCPGFVAVNVADVELNQAHAYVLQDNGMAMRSQSDSQSTPT